MIGKKHHLLFLSVNVLSINAMREIITFKPIPGVMTFSREEKQIIDRLPFIIEKIRKERAKGTNDHEHTKDHRNQSHACHQYFQRTRNGNSIL
jgi:hypothetical protein